MPYLSFSRGDPRTSAPLIDNHVSSWEHRFLISKPPYPAFGWKHSADADSTREASQGFRSVALHSSARAPKRLIQDAG